MSDDDSSLPPESSSDGGRSSPSSRSESSRSIQEVRTATREKNKSKEEEKEPTKTSVKVTKSKSKSKRPPPKQSKEEAKKKKDEERLEKYQSFMSKVRRDRVHQIAKKFQSLREPPGKTKRGTYWNLSANASMGRLATVNIPLTDGDRIEALAIALRTLASGKIRTSERAARREITATFVLRGRARGNHRPEIAVVVKLKNSQSDQALRGALESAVDSVLGATGASRDIFGGNGQVLIYQVYLHGASEETVRERAGKIGEALRNPFTQGSFTALHSFNRSIASDLAFFKLRMHDFPCLFETLCVCRSIVQAGAPYDRMHLPQTSCEWSKYVLKEWATAPTELRDICMEGSCYEFVYYIDMMHPEIVGDVASIVPVDIHSQESALEELIKNANENASEDARAFVFYMVFEYDHVVPMLEANLRAYVQYVEKVRAEKTCVKPFYLEDSISLCRKKIAKQCEHLQLKPMSEPERYKKLLFLRSSTNMKETYSIGLDPVQDALLIAQKQDKRAEKFETHALCGLDIETYVDDKEKNVPLGNFVPYLICIHGRLQRIASEMRNGRRVPAIVTDEVHEAFWGVTCVQQFVDFLIQRKYYQNLYEQEEFGERQRKKFGLRVKNVFFAHNGFKFDYRFLYEELYCRLGYMTIIGDMRQTKSLQGKGLYFYDTALFFQASLKRLAETFFPADPSMRKLDGSEIVKFTKDDFLGLSEEKKREAETYCLQDALLVQAIAYKFFKMVYCTYQGHAFLKTPFFFSSANLAWESWAQQYLRFEIRTNLKTLKAERESYRGGITCCFRSRLKAGISVDINSSYPASMMNLMPLEVVGVGNYEKQPIVTYNLYFAKVEFPDAELFPCIAVKTDAALVCPLVLEEFHWLWGCELILANERGARILISQVVEYRPEYTHRDFIDSCYRERIKAKQNGDTVNDLYQKLRMNSQYGKHGTKAHKKTFLCDEVTAERMYQREYQRYEDALICEQDGIEVFEPCVTRIPSKTFALYQLKRGTEADEVGSCGASVRFAAYITALSRCNIMRGVYLCEKVFGSKSIVYMDTDSIYLDLCHDVDVPEVRFVDEKEEEHVDELNLVLENSCPDQAALIKIRRAIGEKLQQARIDELRLPDAQNVNIEQEMAFLDDQKLGCFKVEDFLYDCLFLGSKQYAVRKLIGDEHIESASKIAMKGIPTADRQRRKMQAIYDEMMQNDKQLAFQKFTVTTVFKQCGTGVHIHSVEKYIRATFTKRVHDLASDTSRPYPTVTKYCENYELTSKEAQQIKDKLIADQKSPDLTIAEHQLQSISQLKHAFAFDDKCRKLESHVARRRGFLRLRLLHYDLTDEVFAQLHEFVTKKPDVAQGYYAQHKTVATRTTELLMVRNKDLQIPKCDVDVYLACFLTAHNILDNCGVKLLKGGTFNFLLEQLRFQIYHAYRVDKQDWDNDNQLTQFDVREVNKPISIAELVFRIADMVHLAPESTNKVSLCAMLKKFDAHTADYRVQKRHDMRNADCSQWLPKDYNDVRQFLCDLKSVKYVDKMLPLLTKYLCNVVFVVHYVQAVQLVKVDARANWHTQFARALEYLGAGIYMQDEQFVSLVSHVFPSCAKEKSKTNQVRIKSGKLPPKVAQFMQIVEQYCQLMVSSLHDVEVDSEYLRYWFEETLQAPWTKMYVDVLQRFAVKGAMDVESVIALQYEVLEKAPNLNLAVHNEAMLDFAQYGERIEEDMRRGELQYFTAQLTMPRTSKLTVLGKRKRSEDLEEEKEDHVWVRPQLTVPDIMKRDLDCPEMTAQQKLWAHDKEDPDCSMSELSVSRCVGRQARE